MKRVIDKEMFGYKRHRNRVVDGHVHTELCPHGSGDSTAKMIEKAIDLRVEKVCLTEHAPLPRDFRKVYVGDMTALATASLSLAQVDSYLELGRYLQREYGTRIDISLGFEIDYIPGFEDEIREFLDTYGPMTEDNILSVHFMKGAADGFWCLDYSPEEFEKGFGPWLDNQSELYARYFSLVQEAVTTDFGYYTPKRIGHIDLIKKYQAYFGFNPVLDCRNMDLLKKIFMILHGQKRELDFNAAGLRKPYCGEVYPNPIIQGLAYVCGVPYVMGSDAHSIADIEETWKFHNREQTMEPVRLEVELPVITKEGIPKVEPIRLREPLVDQGPELITDAIKVAEAKSVNRLDQTGKKRRHKKRRHK